MHTPEQAASLWCPMSRVAQAGSIDIPVAYNRSLTKQVKAAEAVAYANADDFKLGGDAVEAKTIMVMTAQPGISMAANCIGDKCAMWRWGAASGEVELRSAPSMTPGAAPIQFPHIPKIKSDYGFCGLAGRPEIF